MTRFVASALQGRRIGADGQWASALALGSNREGDHRPSHSLLLESKGVLGGHTIFGRFEHVRKSAHDLDLEAFPEDRAFDVAAASLGYIRDFTRARGMTLGVGAPATVNFVPQELVA